jgi:hypothetical protein
MHPTVLLLLCIFVAVRTLPSNSRKDTHTDTQTNGKDEVGSSAMMYRVHTKFHINWFNHSEVSTGVIIDSIDLHKPALIFLG